MLMKTWTISHFDFTTHFWFTLQSVLRKSLKYIDLALKISNFECSGSLDNQGFIEFINPFFMPAHVLLTNGIFNLKRCASNC